MNPSVLCLPVSLSQIASTRSFFHEEAVKREQSNYIYTLRHRVCETDLLLFGLFGLVRNSCYSNNFASSYHSNFPKRASLSPCKEFFSTRQFSAIHQKEKRFHLTHIILSLNLFTLVSTFYFTVCIYLQVCVCVEREG